MCDETKRLIDKIHFLINFIVQVCQAFLNLGLLYQQAFRIFCPHKMFHWFWCVVVRACLVRGEEQIYIQKTGVFNPCKNLSKLLQFHHFQNCRSVQLCGTILFLNICLHCCYFCIIVRRLEITSLSHEVSFSAIEKASHKAHTWVTQSEQDCNFFFFLIPATSTESLKVSEEGCVVLIFMQNIA